MKKALREVLRAQNTKAHMSEPFLRKQFENILSLWLFDLIHSPSFRKNQAQALVVDQSTGQDEGSDRSASEAIYCHTTGTKWSYFGSWSCWPVDTDSDWNTFQASKRVGTRRQIRRLASIENGNGAAPCWCQEEMCSANHSVFDSLPGPNLPFPFQHIFQGRQETYLLACFLQRLDRSRFQAR